LHALQTARAKKEAPPESATDKVLAEEADMMRHITQKQALRAAKELATDTVYTRSMSTGWKPPSEAREGRLTAAAAVVCGTAAFAQIRMCTGSALQPDGTVHAAVLSHAPTDTWAS
jgi:hypothetical protein